MFDTSELERVMYRTDRPRTGPKGVIADAERHKAQVLLQRQAERARVEEQLRRQAVTVSASAAISAASSAAADASDDDDDDAASRRYRMARLKELKKAAEGDAARPTFGGLELIGVEDYLDRVDNTGHAETFVVVHLYEEFVASCVRLNFKLEELAKRYNRVRFVAVPAQDAKEGLDVDELPILIAYRGGEFVSSARRVGKAEGGSLSVGLVEETLRGMKVELLSSSAGLSASELAELEKMREHYERIGLGEGGGEEADD